jgi:GT2 family glycosyltransferase
MTLACVGALLAMSAPAALDILVIDNGSGGGSAERLRRQLPPGVELLALPENLGFGRGNNVGLRRAIDGDYNYALLINNDAFATPDMLARLLAAAEASIALVSPKIYYEAQPQTVWFAGARRKPLTLDIADTGRGQPDSPTVSVDRDVDYLLGTCLLVNLAAVAQVGLFDERYFMYFEDLDWSIRLQQAGYRLRLAAGAHLYHRVAISSGGLESPLRRYHLARSGVLFWRTHWRQGNLVAILLFRAGSAIKMTIRLLLSGNVSAAAAYWRGLRDGLREKPGVA